MSKSIQTLENYHQVFKKMLQLVALLNTNYSSESDIEDISDDCVAEFVEEMGFETLKIFISRLKIRKKKSEVGE